MSSPVGNETEKLADSSTLPPPSSPPPLPPPPPPPPPLEKNRNICDLWFNDEVNAKNNCWRYSLESEANDDNILYSGNCLLEGIDVLEVPNTFKEFIDIMKDL